MSEFKFDLIVASRPWLGGEGEYDFYAVLGRIDYGDTIEDILADNPDLSRDAVEAALAYARTHPRVERFAS